MYLTIHPQDQSTTFLKPCYGKLTDNVLITNDKTREELMQAVADRDRRCLLMGHGSPAGLLAVGQFPDTGGYVIDAEFAPLLAGGEHVFIWCHARAFVERHRLKGFYSDMFISEELEAWICGLREVSEADVVASNDCFSEQMSGIIHLPAMEIHAHMMSGSYAELAKYNPVAKYNIERLHFAA